MSRLVIHVSIVTLVQGPIAEGEHQHGDDATDGHESMSEANDTRVVLAFKGRLVLPRSHATQSITIVPMTTLVAPNER